MAPTAAIRYACRNLNAGLHVTAFLYGEVGVDESKGFSEGPRLNTTDGRPPEVGPQLHSNFSISVQTAA